MAFSASLYIQVCDPSLLVDLPRGLPSAVRTSSSVMPTFKRSSLGRVSLAGLAGLGCAGSDVFCAESEAQPQRPSSAAETSRLMTGVFFIVRYRFNCLFLMFCNFALSVAHQKERVKNLCVCNLKAGMETGETILPRFPAE